MSDSVGDERAQSGLVQMLQLASATEREMLAGRRRVVRAVDQAAGPVQNIPRRSVRDIAAIGGNAIAARCYAG